MPRGFVVICMVLAAGCGGGGESTAPNQPPPPVDLTKPTSISAVAGTGQTVRIKSAVPGPVTFKVTNINGTGLASVSVAFSVSAEGGTLAASSGVTATDGTVSLPAWTMGSTTGTATVTASVGSTLQATASVTARLPYWTVMVYMAADNNLAAYGVFNLYQMAAAGVNPEVQLVVQAEFNPEALSQAGWTPAIVDRPNYDTFRYVMDGSVSRPPNNALIGPATDIGNVNMTDPSQLRAFVQWAEQTAPAEHTVLVLWNHGGDEAGLIVDETSAPNNVMTLPQLHSALTGLPSFDIIYFEMCLMGGYEPLSAVRDLAQTAVASEDAEYVAGWDFQRFLQTMYADPTIAAPTLAGRLADAFDAAYASLGFSETISAYNLGGFSAVDASVSQLGSALLASPSVTAAGLASASAGVQRYTDMPWVADLVDLSDSLRSHFTDTSVVSAATAVRQAVLSPSFLITTHHRTGTLYKQADESRSHGLTIVMPAGGTSAIPSAGMASMTSYNQEFPTTTWGSFLKQYTSALQSQQFTNIGTNPLTLYMVWDTVFAKKGWLEILMFEPDGSLYSPLFGTLSPSGQFSADAQLNKTYYEGWAANQFVESGEYYYLAWLVVDSTNYQPGVDVQYRFGNTALTSLYGPGTYPRLSLQTSFLNDKNASLTSVLNGAYTDLKAVSSWTTPPPNTSGPSLAPSAIIPLTGAPTLTPQQVAAMTGLARGIRAGQFRITGGTPSSGVKLHGHGPVPITQGPHQ